MKIRIKTYNGELPSYLTVGKVYDGVVSYDSPHILILDDYGDELDVRLDSSNHLNGGSWEVVMSEFDVNGYNSHDCDIHNHGYYLGAQSQQGEVERLQTEIDELQGRIDEALQLLEYNEYTDSALQAIDILKGNKDEN